VQRTVGLVEDELLRWGKQARREGSGNQGGNIVWLLAASADQIPADLDEEREKFLLRGQDQNLCLTLRPFTLEELGYLLERACDLRDEHKGPLQRLVSAMVVQGPRAAMLHAHYQQARDNSLATAVQAGNRPPSLRTCYYPASPLAARLPFGRKGDDDRAVWFSYLGDLLELVKVLE
jgi:hypothetical protein